ncbi:phosphotransferase [Oceanobacillus damuensis]|uniref:phosphotransferase n=1 Tax=Oceanobacillus damuensis TaxID=937928 RepID=UPI00082BB550|nr:phosphotransferase [Oceanobacillus damuensis]
MDKIKKVMEAYKVYPIRTEKITERLYRVNDGQRDYALKMSKLNEANIEKWQNVYYLANEKNLSEIVPVYLTKNGKLFEKFNEAFFYLTPWIDIPARGNDENTIKNTMHRLASVHEKTKNSQRISSEKLKENFHTYQTFCKQLPSELLSIIRQFEGNRYMSPFELLVCTQYRDLEYATNANNELINDFLEQNEAHIPWNRCLCHGNLRKEHIADRHLLNWENAGYDLPATDLAVYFSHLTGNYDQPVETITEGFKIYKEKNDLSGPEMQLLSIYLFNPSSYITIVRDYMGRSSTKPMTDQITELQQQYRKILFAIKWRKFIREEYESISFDNSAT